MLVNCSVMTPSLNFYQCKASICIATKVQNESIKYGGVVLRQRLSDITKHTTFHHINIDTVLSRKAVFEGILGIAEFLCKVAVFTYKAMKILYF